MPRKKQAKGKSRLPGIYISSLLGSNSDKSKKTEFIDKKPSDDLASDAIDNSKLLEYEEAVICRTVVELALANLLLGSSTKPKMAPPTDSSSGFSKFQDLGRSLLGFLIGSGQDQANQSAATRRPPTQGKKSIKILLLMNPAVVFKDPGLNKGYLITKMYPPPQ